MTRSRTSRPSATAPLGRVVKSEQAPTKRPSNPALHVCTAPPATNASRCNAPSASSMSMTHTSGRACGATARGAAPCRPPESDAPPPLARVQNLAHDLRLFPIPRSRWSGAPPLWAGPAGPTNHFQLLLLSGAVTSRMWSNQGSSDPASRERQHLVAEHDRPFRTFTTGP